MKTASRFAVIAVLTTLATVAAAADQNGLTNAKLLYASASYEEALAALGTAESPEDVDQVDVYRALCLLALGKTQDAERALEVIVARRPLYALNDAQVSPRLIALFHDVRKRTLPTAVKTLYKTAKASFEADKFAAASDQFKQVLAIVSDPDAADSSSSFEDLKQLADGFLKLTDSELAVAKKTAAPASQAAATSAPVAPPKIYSADDVDVRPPIVISQELPRWVPPATVYNARVFSGAVEIVIDETGAVEAASLLQAVFASYDLQLLAAAKNWKYEPARKGNQPVKYRKAIGVVLKGERVKGDTGEAR